LAVALPAGAWLRHYRALAATAEKLVKITGIRTLGLANVGDGCLIRIDTDAGLTGYGEAGLSAKMARSRIELLNQRLIGEDPLAIERLFYLMTAPQNPFVPQIPLVSGIDIALWDLAGKILGYPVYRLIGGPMRKAVPIYAHGRIANMTDAMQCRDWAQKTKAGPEGFTLYKFGVGSGERQRSEPWPATLEAAELHRVARGYANLRDAVGPDIGIAMHCTGQFDLPSAAGLCRAIEPVNPVFIEDPLNFTFSEAWRELKRGTRVPILTGEKNEMVAGFRPFLDNGVVDYIHPDPAYAGGITGCRKIADYAALSRTPMALHIGPASLVRFYAAAHIGGAVQNLFKIENLIGEYRGFKEKMAAGPAPAIRNGLFALPEGPGLGLTINEDWVKQHLAKDEPYWG
jgi:L-alanine-DL-glutamate epimerase-like enolase superfamily enzyme